MENNILKIYQNQSTWKLSNPRWRPTWPPIGLQLMNPNIGHNFLHAGPINAVWLEWRVLVAFTFCMLFRYQKLIFSLIFTPKCEKLHYALWQLLRAITRAPRAICFAGPSRATAGPGKPLSRSGPITTAFRIYAPRSRRRSASRGRKLGVVPSLPTKSMGSVISSPSGVRGRAPAENGFYA